jgi:small subunit ribosomal protein S8
MNSDPIADLLTRIRNACSAGLMFTEIPHSRLKEEIVKLLLQEGYIRSYELRQSNDKTIKHIRVLLKYDAKGYPVIRKIQRVSRPGLRKYAGVDNLPRIISGAGLAIISTHLGLRSDRAARRDGVGGEVLCYLY